MYSLFQSLSLAPQILVKMEVTAVIMAMEHTTVLARVHTRDKTARKVSMKYQYVRYFVSSVPDSVLAYNLLGLKVC